MTIFSVYTPPASNMGDDERLVRTRFIPDSKAFLALVLPFIWLIWHRLWWPALFYALVSTALILSLTTWSGLVFFVLTFVPGLYLFLEGNDLRRKALERRGWRHAAMVEGQNLASAEIRYFHSISEKEHPEDQKGLSSGSAMTKNSNMVDSGIDFLATPESI